MGRKIFIRIFFEKRNMLTIYIWIITMFTIFLGIESIFLSRQFEESFCPDIVINGAMDEDGVMRYKMYNDIGDVADKLRDTISIQPVVIRNLLTVSDDFNLVEYRIYGMEDRDIETFSSYLKKGRLPKEGKYEVVLGNYAARYFQVEVGDKLELGITLKKENLEEEGGKYTVVGILSDNISYFKGSIIVSKDTWCQKEGNVAYNSALIYAGDDEDYASVISAINSLDNEDAMLISVTNNYSSNSSARKSFYFQIAICGVISIIIIILLFVFLMRGMSKKIGLLKALGLPEKNIIKIFCGGLCIVTLISIIVSLGCEYGMVMYMNSKANKFYGFPVSEYSLSAYSILSVVGLNIINMLAASMTIIWLGKRVSPREAMLKS